MRLNPLVAVLLFTQLSYAEPVRLIDKSASGSQYRVATDSTIVGELQAPTQKDKPPQTIKISGQSRIDYVERILPNDPREAEYKSLRIYELVEFKKKSADRTDESTIRPAVRRLVLMKKGQHKVPFSPDGPLVWSEIDLLRTDIMVSALGGLLPDKEVEPGNSWNASTSAVIELTDTEKIDKGELTCTLEKVEENGPRTIARVSFTGTIEGVNEDGPMRQKLEGALLVDVKAQCITYLQIDGTLYLLDDKKNEAGKITGTFKLLRAPLNSHKGLSDEAIKGIGLEPNEENTRLLVDNEQLGVRFVHSRNWRVVRNTGRQITLDETGGAGLLITLDKADAVPAASKYLREAMKDLTDRGAKLTNRTGPTHLGDGIDRFVLDAEVGKDAVTMDYFVVVQANGGATLAARIPLANREARMKELERLARSFTITRRLDGK